MKKQHQSESNLVASITPESHNIALEQISRITDEKLNKILQSNAVPSSNSTAASAKSQLNISDNSEMKQGRSNSISPQRSRSDRRQGNRNSWFCEYCKLNNHTTDRCRKRIHDENSDKSPEVPLNSNRLLEL